MSEEQLQFTDEAIQGIISRYTREAGVRQLERNIGSVARKVALKVAQGKGDVFTVKVEELEDYLGHEMFFHEMARQTLPNNREQRKETRRTQRIHGVDNSATLLNQDRTSHFNSWPDTVASSVKLIGDLEHVACSANIRRGAIWSS